MAKISLPSIPKAPKVPLLPAFNANRALGMSGQEKARSVFRPIAKPALAKAPSSWTGT